MDTLPDQHTFRNILLGSILQEQSAQQNYWLLVSLVFPLNLIAGRLVFLSDVSNALVTA
ncbi:hypothetical protein ACQ4M3_08105 [Leptolyngbya sp. AN03gr2]|uniref:hypothetical protein n=1 Tax=unclassified Leptolyngbya TaxID=2650499 RepID=UPI003D314E85